MKNYFLIIFLFIFSARPDLEVGGEAVGSPREDSLLPTDKQRKKIEKEGYSGVFSRIFLLWIYFRILNGFSLALES